MTVREVLTSTLLVLAVSVIGPLGHAESAGEVRFRLDIPAQPLLAALKSLSDETGLEVMYFTDKADGARSAPLRGEFSEPEALTVMLEGTNLKFERLAGQRAVAIRPAEEPDGESVSPGPGNPEPAPSAQWPGGARRDRRRRHADRGAARRQRHANGAAPSRGKRLSSPRTAATNAFLTLPRVFRCSARV